MNSVNKAIAFENKLLLQAQNAAGTEWTSNEKGGNTFAKLAIKGSLLSTTPTKAKKHSQK